MGQSLNVFCRDCKIDAYLGYGGSSMHVGGWKKTLKEFDEEVRRMQGCDKSLKGCERIKSFLEEHEGHDIEYYGEYSSVRGNDLWYEDPFDSERDELQAEDWTSYLKLYREPK